MQWITRPATTLNTAFRLTRPLRLSPACPAPRRKFMNMPSLAEAATQAVLRRSSPNLSIQEDELSIPSSPPPHLSSAQMSRAAAQSIRLSLENDGLSDSLFIWNSVRISRYLSAGRLPTSLPGLYTNPAHFSSIAIHFAKSVHPKLCAHTLIHRLIRQGEINRAHDVAVSMLDEGLPVRVRTLEAIIRSRLPQNGTFVTEIEPRWRETIKSVPKTKDALLLEEKMIQDESTRLTFVLIRSARNARVKRSKAMLKMLITLSIINGEIGIAALIWGWFARDWNTYLAEEDARAVAVAKAPKEERARVKRQIPKPTTTATPPTRESLSAICSYIDDLLSSVTFEQQPGQAPPDVRCPEENTDPPWSAPDPYLPALQALAHLASYLHARTISLPAISPLIRTMARVPPSKARVWIEDPWTGEPRQVVAYDYFHFVLKSLCLNMPRARRFLGLEPRMYSYLPALDLSSYNTLLNYALRHRFSPSLASHILHHMLHINPAKYKPDAVTYNILLRSSTLLRRNDLVERVLQSLHQALGSSQHDNSTSVTGRHRDAVLAVPPRLARPKHDDQTNCRRPDRQLPLTSESLTVYPSPDDSDRQSRPLVDGYTISALLHHFAAISRPDIVLKLIEVLLPELGLIKHPGEADLGPTTSSNGPWELPPLDHLSTEMRKNVLGIIRRDINEREPYTLRPFTRVDRQAALKKAVQYGPRFFTSVLNSLQKAKLTGTAERTFLLAKSAEQWSWTLEKRGKSDRVSWSKRTGLEESATNCPDEVVHGWCLPIEAYTIMICAYADRAWKVRSFANDPPDFFAIEDDPDPVHVSAWASHIIHKRHLLSSALRNYGSARHSQRRVHAELGRHLYEKMWAGAQKTYRSMRETWLTRPSSFDVASSAHAPVDLETLPYAHPSHKDALLPIPDAHFFRAVLALLLRCDRRWPKYATVNEHAAAQATLALDQANEAYSRYGVMPTEWNPLLQTIRDDMEEAGLEFPLKYRWIFAGRAPKAETPVQRGFRRVDPKERRVPYATTKKGRSEAGPTLNVMEERARRRGRARG